MLKPILQIDLQELSWRVYFCGMCGDFLIGTVCQDCHTKYTRFQMSHTKIEFINQEK